MGDARSDIGKALESRLTKEQIDYLLTEILASTKQVGAEFICKECKKRQIQKVTIPDARGVTSSLIELANQAWGRPGEATGGDEEKIVFERVIYLGDDAS